jgi:hypothetical protein
MQCSIGVIKKIKKQRKMKGFFSNKAKSIKAETVICRLHYIQLSE